MPAPIEFVDPPVIGERVNFKMQGPNGQECEAVGKYHGVLKEHGDYVHFFTQGTIAGIPQPCFGVALYREGVSPGKPPEISSTLSVDEIMRAEHVDSPSLSDVAALTDKLADAGLAPQIHDLVNGGTLSRSTLEALANSLGVQSDKRPWRVDRAKLHAWLGEQLDEIDKMADAMPPMFHAAGLSKIMLGAAVIALGTEMADPDPYLTQEPLAD
jgi:hypothetical protein